MDMIGDELVTSISEFKKNPKGEIEKAQGKPFAVLTNNRPSFFVVPVDLYEELAEILWEKKIEGVLRARLTESLDNENLVVVENPS